MILPYNNIFRTAIFIFFYLIVSACSHEKHFMTDVKDVDFSHINQIVLKEDTVKIEDDFSGNICIKDSILLMCSSRYNDFLFRAYSLVSGKRIASFAPIGNSLKEFLPSTNIYLDIQNISNTDWGIWTYDRSKELYKLINVSKSISQHTTVIESTFNYNNIKAGFRYSFGKLFFHKDYIYARMQEYMENDREYCTPVKYYKCVIDTQLLVGDPIDIYSNGISPDENLHALASKDSYNMKHGKIAIAMEFLPQLNILNLDEERVCGYRYNSYSSFKSVLENRMADKWKNIGITSNDEYIFVLTTQNFENEFPPCGNRIYVFNWNGCPLQILEVVSPLTSISIDGNILYGQGLDYTCYKYDLKLDKK